MLAGSAAISALVAVLIWRGFRRPAGEVRETRWTLGLGVGFSMVVLSAALAGALWLGERQVARGDVIGIEARAHQWGWTFVQPGPNGNPYVTQGTLYIPAGQPVEVAISAEDVIHSFWVPRLAGKMDAIPGRVNLLRIEAAAPGRYLGRCAEFCGLGHTGMNFAIVAYDPAQGAPSDDVMDAGGDMPQGDGP